MQERSEATCHLAMPQCCYLAKGAKRPSHTTNTIKFDRIPFDPCNSIKRLDLCPFDQKNLTYLQPPACHFSASCTASGVASNNWSMVNPLLRTMCSIVCTSPQAHLLSVITPHFLACPCFFLSDIQACSVFSMCTISGNLRVVGPRDSS